ncbi:uncharacterized protein LOC112553505 [Pomacea canaliculata]|uniref:uncharacterized protein LOC112553505 n=1 Tax=Pomacea canaliculata TaxID=400727 RepID=UPI000D739181|nr:uncharacterized protein LOC112553505 [Pomacea canaliculata]
MSSWGEVVVAVLTCLIGAQIRGEKAALLIIDVQDCFLPGGSLAVKDGHQVIPVINKLRHDYEDKFSLVILSQDWHCPNHVSFASQHVGADPMSQISLTYDDKGMCAGDSSWTALQRNRVSSPLPTVDCSTVDVNKQRKVTQTLWPDHCVQNITSGPTSSKISSLLTRKDTDIVIRKGDTCEIDSYSAFNDNGEFRQTPLHNILKNHGIRLVVVAGLALDYCVYFTSKDAVKLGYKVFTVLDACRGVAPDSQIAAMEDMKKAGIELVQSGDLEGALQDTSEGGSYTLDIILLMAAAVCITVSFIVA